eukprot:10498862-Ditylum_brightwellii.AAC.1
MRLAMALVLTLCWRFIRGMDVKTSFTTSTTDQSGTSIVVTAVQTSVDSPVTKQRKQLGLGALGRGNGSDRKIHSTDADPTLHQSNLCESDSLYATSIVSTT